MSERDVKGNFAALRGALQERLKEVTTADDQANVLILEIGLSIVESIVLDLNRIADALEMLATSEFRRNG